MGYSGCHYCSKDPEQCLYLCEDHRLELIEIKLKEAEGVIEQVSTNDLGIDLITKAREYLSKYKGEQE